MKATLKVTLLSMIILVLTAVIGYAQESESAAPPAEQPPPPQAESAPVPPPGSPRFTLDESYIAGLLEKVKQNDPNEAQRLENLRKENPGLFQVEMRKLAFQQHRDSREGMGPDRAGRREARMGGPEDESMGLRGKERTRDRLQNMEEELTSWLVKNEPSEANELAVLKGKNPRAYMRRLSVDMKKYREIMDAEQTNPAMAELLKKDLVLKQKRNELLEKYKGATDEKQKTELMAQLKEVTSERFDVVLQKKQLKYEEFKKKLEELQKNVTKSQADLENYKKNKDELIKKHLDELINQAGQFDWD
ncbi:MAG: hypothetical protein WCE45_00630 [Sedimentisphaerales bacterium]